MKDIDYSPLRGNYILHHDTTSHRHRKFSVQHIKAQNRKIKSSQRRPLLLAVSSTLGDEVFGTVRLRLASNIGSISLVVALLEERTSELVAAVFAILSVVIVVGWKSD